MAEPRKVNRNNPIGPISPVRVFAEGYDNNYRDRVSRVRGEIRAERAALRRTGQAGSERDLQLAARENILERGRFARASGTYNASGNYADSYARERERIRRIIANRR